MNIFATSTCPNACALVLDDARLIKMVLETAQILCTVFIEWEHATRVEAPPRRPVYMTGTTLLYHPTHVNHPCTRWARDYNNYAWLHSHLEALSREYTLRFDRRHACAELIDPLHLFDYEGGMTTPPRCWGSFVPEGRVFLIPRRGEIDVFDGYRQYLAWKWFHQKRPPRWTGTMHPHWYNPEKRVINRIESGATDKEIKAELRSMPPDFVRFIEQNYLTPTT